LLIEILLVNLKDIVPYRCDYFNCRV